MYLNILIIIHFLLFLLWNYNGLKQHVGLLWVFDYAYRSPMCLRWGMYVGPWSGMSVSNQTRQSPMGMSVSDGSPIIIIFWWTPKIYQTVYLIYLVNDNFKVYINRNSRWHYKIFSIYLQYFKPVEKKYDQM